MAPKYHSIKAGELKRCIVKICNRAGLMVEDDLKHCKITRPETGECFILPLNHPGKDVPSGFVKRAKKHLVDWHACTEGEFDKSL